MTTVNKFEGDRGKYFCARTLNNLCNFGNKAQQILNAAGRFIRQILCGHWVWIFQEGKENIKVILFRFPIFPWTIIAADNL